MPILKNVIGELIELWTMVKTKEIVLPVNLITVKEDNIWIISTLNGNKIEEIKLKIWKIYDDKIEIFWCINDKDNNCYELDAILNDVSNYDKNKFNIKIK